MKLVLYPHFNKDAGTAGLKHILTQWSNLPGTVQVPGDPMLSK